MKKYFLVFALFLYISNLYADGGGMHAKYQVKKPYPTVEIELLKDAKSGYNLVINVTNFTFTPLAVNGENVPKEGHSHVFINGMKIRHYSPYMHIPDKWLKKGKNVIRVTLNANDHADYYAGDKIIEQSKTVTK